MRINYQLKILAIKLQSKKVTTQTQTYKRKLIKTKPVRKEWEANNTNTISYSTISLWSSYVASRWYKYGVFCKTLFTTFISYLVQGYKNSVDFIIVIIVISSSSSSSTCSATASASTTATSATTISAATAAKTC